MVYKARLRNLCLGLALLCAGAGLLLWPREVMDAGRDALSLCGNVIVPSLFPFFVLSGLTVGLGLAEYPGRLLHTVMKPLFRVNGNCASALVLGLVGGYPVGAKTAVELYQNGLCSKTEGERLLGFCNNSGPAFLLGVVGAGIFGSAQIGVLLCLIHMAAAILVGLIFRFYRPGEGPSSPAGSRRSRTIQPGFPAAFTQAVGSSLSSVLNVCAYVVLFGVVLRLLTLSGAVGALSGLLSRLFSPLGLTRSWAERLVSGFVEMSNGVAGLSAADRSGGVPMAAFLLGWGGVSVHCQTMSLVRESGLSLKPYLSGKLLHGLFSALLAAWCVRLLPGTVEAAASLSAPLATGFKPGFFSLALASAIGAGIWFLLLTIYGKIGGGNRRPGRI